MKTFLIFSIVFASLSLVLINGQQCLQSVKTISNLNVSSFASGRWYVYKSSRLYRLPGISCAYGDFTANRSRFNANFVVLNTKQTVPVFFNKNSLGFDINIVIPFFSQNITIASKVSSQNDFKIKYNKIVAFLNSTETCRCW